jgi:hypothetical protein
VAHQDARAMHFVPWQSTTHAAYTPPRNSMKREGKYISSAYSNNSLASMNNKQQSAISLQLYRYRFFSVLLGTE